MTNPAPPTVVRPVRLGRWLVGHGAVCYVGVIASTVLAVRDWFQGGPFYMIGVMAWGLSAVGLAVAATGEAWAGVRLVRGKARWVRLLLVPAGLINLIGAGLLGCFWWESFQHKASTTPGEMFVVQGLIAFFVVGVALVVCGIVRASDRRFRALAAAQTPERADYGD